MRCKTVIARVGTVMDLIRGCWNDEHFLFKSQSSNSLKRSRSRRLPVSSSLILQKQFPVGIFSSLAAMRSTSSDTSAPTVGPYVDSIRSEEVQSNFGQTATFGKDSGYPSGGEYPTDEGISSAYPHRHWLRSNLPFLLRPLLRFLCLIDSLDKRNGSTMYTRCKRPNNVIKKC